MPTEKDVTEESEDNKPLFIGFQKPGQIFRFIDFSFDHTEINFGPKKAKLLRSSKRKVSNPQNDESKDQFRKAIESYSREMNAYIQGTTIIDLIIPFFTIILHTVFSKMRRNSHTSV